MDCAEYKLSTRGWQAELDLRYARREARSYLAERRHHGPLTVQRSFYPEGEGLCHTYILHPPGGVVGGDSLSVNVLVEEEAEALLTTPAAGKFYRSEGESAWQGQHLRLAPGAALEWLPQENIVFDGAHITSRTLVELEPDSRFIGWEIYCLGRPASGEAFTQGLLQTSFELRRQGRPIWLERGCFEAGTPVMRRLWGLQGHIVMGTMVATLELDELQSVRSLLEEEEGFYISQLPGVLVCRYLGDDAPKARAGFSRLWALLRPQLLHREACCPRIWNT